MKTQCPKCKTQITTPDEYKNKRIKCTKCKADFICTEFLNEPVHPQETAITKEQIEICTNCGRRIEKLEHSYNYEGHTVCKDCKQRLEDLSSDAPKVKEKTVRTLWRTHPVAWVVLILFVLFLIGVFVGDSDDEGSSDSSRRVARTQPVERPKPATQKPIRKPRTRTKPIEIKPTISDITFEEIEQLFGIKSKLTTLQKKELFKDYKGKWVEWTGQVRSSSDSWGSLTMSFRHQLSTWTSDVTVYFPKSAKNALMQLEEDKWVTYQGKLDDYGELLGHTLKEGKIIEVHTVPLSVHQAKELPKPQRSHFEIIDFSWRRDKFGMVLCAGEVKNISSIPQGVKLQAIARDGNGRVVEVQEFWPASINNITPGQSYPFTYHISEQTDIKAVELRVIDASQW